MGVSSSTMSFMSNFRFIRENWLKGEFFSFLPDQPNLISSQIEDTDAGIFKHFYRLSIPFSWFYLQGDLETLCRTDLVRIMGSHNVESICRQTLYLPDNSSQDVLVFSWYTRRGMFRGLIVDPKDKTSIAFALNQMKSRSGVI